MSILMHYFISQTPKHRQIACFKQNMCIYIKATSTRSIVKPGSEHVCVHLPGMSHRSAKYFFFAHTTQTNSYTQKCITLAFKQWWCGFPYTLGYLGEKECIEHINKEVWILKRKPGCCWWWEGPLGGKLRTPAVLAFTDADWWEPETKSQRWPLFCRSHATFHLRQEDFQTSSCANPGVKTPTQNKTSLLCFVSPWLELKRKRAITLPGWLKVWQPRKSTGSNQPGELSHKGKNVAPELAAAASE